MEKKKRIVIALAVSGVANSVLTLVGFLAYSATDEETLTQRILGIFGFPAGVFTEVIAGQGHGVLQATVPLLLSFGFYAILVWLLLTLHGRYRGRSRGRPGTGKLGEKRTA